MDAPFPYIGGKKEVASVVWSALGQPRHYIEPFFGSGAVLLARPAYDIVRHVETINDKDGMVANVWRSLQFAPDEVARWCDWPVNHADLIARKRELIQNEEYLLENLVNIANWYDAKLAGYWIWAASCWIGAGMLAVNQRPSVSSSGSGVHMMGMRELGDGEKAPDESYNTGIYRWFRELSNRLRNVRVVCGDWSRVCGGDWQDGIGSEVGIFFDPPYGVLAERNETLYYHDSLHVADEVRAWCLERGRKSSYRIVLAGYFEEHKGLLDEGWTVYRWQTGGGYSNLGKGKNDNRTKEALFMSPHCLDLKASRFVKRV